MADDITLKVGMDPASLLSALKQIEQQAKQTIAAIPTAGQQRSTAANPIPRPSGGVYAPGQLSNVTISASDAAAARRVAVESLGQQLGAAQFARQNVGPANSSERNQIEKQYQALRAQGRAATQGDVELANTLASSQRDSLRSLRDQVSGRQLITKAATEQLAVEQKTAEVRTKTESTPYAKYQAINERLANTFTPVLGPPDPGPSIDEQARKQIETGKERLAIEKQISEIQLRENDDLTRVQRLQLQSNVLFGRRNLEGLPPTGSELLAQSAGTIGRYAIAGAGIYAVANGIKSAVTEAENLQVVMGHLQVQLQTIGESNQFQSLSNSIFRVAKDTGTSVSQIATLTSQFVGAFTGTSGNQTAAAEQATQIAAQLGVIGGLQPAQIFNDLAAAMKAFTDTGSSSAMVQTVQNISDITTTVSQVTGVPIQQLADFLGKIAPIAKTAGLSLKETSAIGAALLQGSGTSGGALAQQFGGVLTEFSKTAGPAIALLVQQVPQITAALNPQQLSTFNAALANSDPRVLFGLAQGFTALSQAQQINIIQTLSSRREGATLAALLQNSTGLTAALKASQDSDGSTQTEFQKRQQQFAQQMKQLQQTLIEIGVTIANSGLLTFATDLAKVLDGLVTPLAAVIGLFDKIPESVRTAAVGIAAATTAFALLSGGGIGPSAGLLGSAKLFSGIGSLSGGIGAAGLTGLASESYRLGGGLLSGIGSILPGVGGTLAGNAIAKTGFGQTAGGRFAAGAVTGAGIGASLGLLGGPFAELSVPTGALLGAGIGGLGDLLFGGSKQPTPTDLSKLTQSQFSKVSGQYQSAQDVVNRGQPGYDSGSVADVDTARQKFNEAKKQLDELNKKYPELKAAVAQGVKVLADIPSTVAAKVTDISTSLADAIAAFQSGDLSLGELDQQFAINEKALSGINGSAALKLLEAMKKQDQDINDKAHQAAFDFQQSLATDTGDADPQATLSSLQTLLTQQTGKAGRAKVVGDIVKAEKALLDQQVADAQTAGDTAKALALLKNGIPINPADQIILVQQQLDDFGGAFQAYLAEYIAAGIEIPAEMTGKLSEIIVAGGDAIGYIRQFLLDQVNGLIAGALGSYLGGGQGQTAEDAAKLATLQKGIADLQSLDPKLGTSDPKTVHGTQAQINTAGKAAATSANDLANARADLMKAYIEQDPVALARFNLQDADRLAAQAITEADKVKAMADKVRAEHALTDAVNAVAVSRISLFQAILQANGDLIGAANAGLAQAQLELTNAISTHSGDAAINAAKSKVVTAQRNADDTVLQQGIDNEKFAYDMKQITAGSFVAYLKNLLALPTLTNKESQDIQLQIKQLTDTLGQQYALDLPTFLKTPTLYESRRLDQTNGGYQDNRQIVITLNANNAVDGQAAIAQIVDVLNGPSRFGTTPRLY